MPIAHVSYEADKLLATTMARPAKKQQEMHQKRQKCAKTGTYFFRSARKCVEARYQGTNLRTFHQTKSGEV